MQLEESCDLVVVHITASLGHEADAALWLARLVRVDVVNEGRLVRYLKVPDVAVALGEEDTIVSTVVTHTHTDILTLATRYNKLTSGS